MYNIYVENDLNSKIFICAIYNYNFQLIIFYVLDFYSETCLIFFEQNSTKKTQLEIKIQPTTIFLKRFLLLSTVEN